MVLCVAAAVLAIIKFVRVIKVNKSNLGKNKVAIAAIIIEAAIIILAIIACISFTM
ncbi:MAG: hypothetical protein MJ200_03400 [Mycoplasmoidaceae bacterium]|nr:hypothetical protein [Mycoplasmoidaceae bacterium]